MALKTFTCTRCDKDFHPGDWSCADEQKHQVASKTYYIPTEGLQVDYGAVTGDSVMSHRRGVIQFSRGTYTTADPEQQEFLDGYGGCISAEQWSESHIPEKERLQQERRKAERLERENNSLLDELKRLKEQNAKKPAAAAPKA